MNVDSAFVFFLGKLFGNETIRTFRETPFNFYDYLELEREFEMAKQKVKIDDNSKITIRIPASFMEVFRAVNDHTDITEYIDSTTYRRQVNVVRDMLKMEAGIIREMFRSIVDDIIRQVGCLLTRKQTYEIKNIIMVGKPPRQC